MICTRYVRFDKIEDFPDFFNHIKSHQTIYTILYDSL